MKVITSLQMFIGSMPCCTKPLEMFLLKISSVVFSTYFPIWLFFFSEVTRRNFFVVVGVVVVDVVVVVVVAVDVVVVDFRLLQVRNDAEKRAQKCQK